MKIKYSHVCYVRTLLKVRFCWLKRHAVLFEISNGLKEIKSDCMKLNLDLTASDQEWWMIEDEAKNYLSLLLKTKNQILWSCKNQELWLSHSRAQRSVKSSLCKDCVWLTDPEPWFPQFLATSLSGQSHGTWMHLRWWRGELWVLAWLGQLCVCQTVCSLLHWLPVSFQFMLRLLSWSSKQLLDQTP